MRCAQEFSDTQFRVECPFLALLWLNRSDPFFIFFISYYGSQQIHTHMIQKNIVQFAQNGRQRPQSGSTPTPLASLSFQCTSYKSTEEKKNIRGWPDKKKAFDWEFVVTTSYFQAHLPSLPPSPPYAHQPKSFNLNSKKKKKTHPIADTVITEPL